MKNIVILIFVLLNQPIYCQTEISGTITYFFNKYQGDKADIGAKVFLIDSLSLREIANSDKLLTYSTKLVIHNIIESLLSLVKHNEKAIDRIKSDLVLIELLESKNKIEAKDKHLLKKNKSKYNNILQKIEPFNKKILAEQNEMLANQEKLSTYKELLNKYNVATKEEWDKYCRDVAITLKLIKTNSEKIGKATTVNGIGSYTLRNIDPGPYYLLFISNNRTGLTIATVEGNFQIQKINVKGDFQDYSYHFNLR